MPAGDRTDWRLLLKRTVKLSGERGQRKRLETTLELSQSLHLAYNLREELNLFWKQPDKDADSRFPLSPIPLITALPERDSMTVVAGF